MTNLQDNIQKLKETITQVFPKPPSIRAKSTGNALKDRLEWGEPALTIIDVRDRESFLYEHITGAVSMPLDSLVETVRNSLALTRDIYVYGETNEETAQAACALREAGFNYVSQLEGGLAAWKAIGGPTEGRIFTKPYSER
jgi:rhodanese-related sulfurtransferase